jgi:diadenosine tetraphosphate (Ap4A) HIT family hydrolase
MDHPTSNADVIFIAKLSVSSLMLFRDQRFRGYSILSFDPWDATTLEALSASEYQAFMDDLLRASGAIRATLRPDHMNYELLGNSNPHLHWHIVPRYRDDPRWGRPIWEDWPRNEFTLNRQGISREECEAIIESIRAEL